LVDESVLGVRQDRLNSRHGKLSSEFAQSCIQKRAQGEPGGAPRTAARSYSPPFQEACCLLRGCVLHRATRRCPQRERSPQLLSLTWCPAKVVVEDEVKRGRPGSLQDEDVRLLG